MGDAGEISGGEIGFHWRAGEGKVKEGDDRWVQPVSAAAGGDGDARAACARRARLLGRARGVWAAGKRKRAALWVGSGRREGRELGLAGEGKSGPGWAQVEGWAAVGFGVCWVFFFSISIYSLFSISNSNKV